MRHKLLIWGVLTFITASVSVGQALTAQANITQTDGQPNTEDCYMQTQEGVVIQLSKICGKSPADATLSNAMLDPNTPIQIELVGSEKPSALWNTIPDSPNAPTKGATYKPAPPQKVQLIEGTKP
jgi:hypothetical protein